MTTLFTPSVNRPLPLAMRGDLHAIRQAYQGKIYWIVKDPLALKYYRFEEEEFAILQMLNGTVSLAGIKERFEREFAPQRIEVKHLQQLLGMFHKNGLVTSHAGGQGTQLLQRRRENDARRRMASFTNLLAIRFRGIDPDWLLTRISPMTHWLFTLPALIGILLLALLAALLFGSRADELMTRLPGMGDFFAAENWLWLAAALGVTKIIHEFGHGLACKRFGGQSHEMGVMLLVFTPCLYCNVSDAWMVPSRWRRAAIGAAGMYFELIVATIAAWLWLFTQPGLLNMLCLNVIFVCTLSTLAFNANPLMRFDGYYILSDLLEIPNLRQKASAALNRKLADWFLGMPPRPDPFLPRKHLGLFALYAVAAAAYRWVIVLSITWTLMQVLKPYGLQVIGQALALFAVVSMVLMPLVHLIKFFQTPGRIRQVNKLRFAGTSLLVLVLLYGIGNVPLPHRVRCRVELRPRDPAVVYVDTPGELTEISTCAGERIAAGAPLATLRNESLILVIERLAGQQHQMEAELESLEQLELLDPAAASQQEAVVEKLRTVEEALASRRRELERLSLAAPRGGVVISTLRRETSTDQRRLGQWHGEPLAQRNLGAYLGRGTPLCQIAEPGAYAAVLTINQGDMEFVSPGQPVSIQLTSHAGRAFSTTIAHVSREEIEQEQPKADGVPNTAAAEFTAAYQAKAPLDDPAGELYPGATGWAKIEVGQQTLWAKLKRWALATFRFEL